MESPITRIIDAATGYTLEPSKTELSTEAKEEIRKLARDVVSDLRYYYPAALKSLPTTAATHLRNTIAKKVEAILLDAHNSTVNTGELGNDL